MIFPWKTVIFRSYVSLPEGNLYNSSTGTRRDHFKHHKERLDSRHLQFPEAEGEKVAHFWIFFPCVPLHWISDVLN